MRLGTGLLAPRAPVRSRPCTSRFSTSRPLAETKLFPGAITQMIKVGENTGTLNEQLTVGSDFYGQELEYKIARLTALFEPAVIVFMGVAVGFVAIAMISAMYGIYQQVQF